MVPAARSLAPPRKALLSPGRAIGRSCDAVSKIRAAPVLEGRVQPVHESEIEGVASMSGDCTPKS